MKKKAVLIVAAAGFLIGCLFIYNYSFQKKDDITAAGTVEVTRADAAPKVSGYIKELKITQGDFVKAGQVVAIISRNDLEIQILRDEAELQRSLAVLRDLEKGAREQEKTAAKATVSALEAVYEKAKADYFMYTELLEKGAISRQQFNAAKSAYETAANSYSAAKENLSLTIEGTRPDVIEAQRKETERLKATLDLGKSQFADTIITSPLNGAVLTKNFEEGEYAGVGAAIATIGDLNDCWVKIYVSSVNLGKIKLNQPAKIKIDAYPEREFSGHIKEISQQAEFTPRQSLTLKERANLVYMVKVAVDNEGGVLKPGMPADVVFK